MAKFNKTTFSSIDEYQDYLQNLFDYLAQSGDYNIYMHQVCSHRTFLFDNIEEKINGIKKYGLSIDYPTICGTTAFMGNASNIDVKKIVDYKFSSKEDQFCSFIFSFMNFSKSLDKSRHPKNLSNCFANIIFTSNFYRCI